MAVFLHDFGKLIEQLDRAGRRDHFRSAPGTQLRQSFANALRSAGDQDPHSLKIATLPHFALTLVNKSPRLGASNGSPKRKRGDALSLACASGYHWMRPN